RLHELARHAPHSVALSLQNFRVSVERGQRAVGEHRQVALKDRQRLTELVEDAQDERFSSLGLRSGQTEHQEGQGSGRNNLQAVLNRIKTVPGRIHQLRGQGEHDENDKLESHLSTPPPTSITPDRSSA